MTARSLAGVVRAPNGEALADVLVERVSADWKNRIDATFTDPAADLFYQPCRMKVFSESEQVWLLHVEGRS